MKLIHNTHFNLRVSGFVWIVFRKDAADIRTAPSAEGIGLGSLQLGGAENMEAGMLFQDSLPPSPCLGPSMSSSAAWHYVLQ